jgi:hypothetical protein
MSESEDKINPTYYSQYKIQPIEFIESLGLIEGFCKGNIIKYTARALHKGGLSEAITDLGKVCWYAETLMGYYEELLEEEGEENESKVDKSECEN